MKVGAIVQARMSSSRLPGKILLKLPYTSEITVLQQVIRRLKHASVLDEIIVATTVNPADDPVVEIARSEGARTFRGSEHDVLGRYYHAATDAGLDVIVRITSDCPCTDPRIIDEVVRHHMDTGADYTSNTRILTYPRGVDTEVATMQALERAFNQATKPYEREHVTIYLYEHPDQFKIENVPAPAAVTRPDLRITIDTPQDYALLCCIFDELYQGDKFFSLESVVKLLTAKPWLPMINKEVLQKVASDSKDPSPDHGNR